PPTPTLSPYTTLFRSVRLRRVRPPHDDLALAADHRTADSPSGPIKARVPGPARRVAARVDHADLALGRPRVAAHHDAHRLGRGRDRKSTRLNSSHVKI